ncbi:MAG: response regulator [Schwartzia succinivorans]|nr:response regulator [Schwartzia succinivorans]
MKQRTYNVTTEEELSAALSEIAASNEYRGASAVLLHVLTDLLSRDEAADILGKAKAALPRAKTVGASVVEFRGPDEGTRHVRLSACFFERSDVEVHEYGPEEDLAALGERIAKELSARPDIRGVEVYHGGSTVGIEDFLAAASEGHEDVPFFGVEMQTTDFAKYDRRACRNFFKEMAEGAVGALFLIGDTVRELGLTLVFYVGADLHIKADAVFGWKMLGRELVVTETEDDFIATRINDMPATEIYHKYLKVLPDEYFVFNICEFPLVLKQGDRLLPRVPPMHDEAKKLYFTGRVRKGDRLRLTYGNSNDIFLNTWDASEDMRRFGPEYVELIPCANRGLFLKEQAHYEPDMYARFVSQPLVFGGSSELYRFEGYGGVMNSTLIAVGIREGEAKVAPPSKCPLETQTAQAHFVPLSDRLAAFVDVAAQELAEETKKAKAANVAKSQFLSNMSHEIRTPINAIMGMNEMILREAKDDAVREYAENIRTASASLLGLVNDILDFSKIEAGKMEIIPVEYELSSVLNDLVNMVRTRAEKKGLTLSVEASPELPTLLFGDEIRIKQVATNILTNAVKYTEKGGVTMRVSFEKGDAQMIRLRFAIRDTGIGIKPEDMKRLYNPFERIEEARNRTVEGTGLGMNITKRLLDLMGSRLEVESVYGEGSTFAFVVEQRVVNWSPIGDFEQAYRRTVSYHHAYHECFTAPEAEVLVVDDTKMNLTVMKGLLKTTKVKLDEAESGAECLALTERKKYDVIFLDHRMPGMDGVETLVSLRMQMHGKNSETPVICLTANAVSGAREWYLERGFNDYLTKPVDGQQLEAMLIKYLPPERVVLTGACAFKGESEGGLPAWLLSSKALESVLDVKTGLTYCGSAEDYLAVLRVFQESAAQNADEIERLFKAKDWKNYTTKVHALKSSARIIGATELSDRAKRLEDAGDRLYVEEIEKDTPMLLALYRASGEALAPLQEPKRDDAALPEIDEASLAEAYAAIREMAAAFDYDSIQFVLEELSKSRVPEDKAERHARLVEAAKKPDWDALKKVLEE